MTDRAEAQPRLPSDLEAAVRCIRIASRAAIERINLVPSETRMSPLAREPLASDLYFRYFFNEDCAPAFWQFRGGQDVGHLERDLAVPALRRLARAEHVNIRPISGLNAMLLVISALGGELGACIVTVSPRSGGHYATGSVVERLGRRSRLIEVAAGQVDQKQLEHLLTNEPVSLVYLDLQNSLTEADITGVADMIRQHRPATRLHVDSSHVLGLVLGGAHTNPLTCGADSFGGSTHKSFPGPHKGVLFTNDAWVARALHDAQFDLVSSHHFAETLALGLAAAEFEVFGHGFSRQVIANARVLAHSLKSHGFDVAGSEPHLTDTHQVWLWHGDLETVTAMSDRLALGGIAVNIQENLAGRAGPAFRLGVNECTFEGAGPDAMRLIAQAFAQARDGRLRVSALDVRNAYGRPHYFPDGSLASS